MYRAEMKKYKRVDRTQQRNNFLRNFKQIKIGDSYLINNYATIVTLYFRLNKSKHSHNEYAIWGENMLKSMWNTPVVIFTDKESSKFLIEECNKLKLNANLYITENIWTVLALIGTNRNRNYVPIYKNQQYLLDPEKKKHTPELYAIWNCKIYFTQSIALVNPFNSKFFIYADFGGWRARYLDKWPDTDFVQGLHENKLKNNILFGQVAPYNMDIFPPKYDVIQGTFFAGSKQALNKLSDSFYEIHDKMLDRGEFVGKDQNILNILAFIKLNSSISRLKTWNLNCSVLYNSWFFFLNFFAQKDDYLCQDDRFSLII